MVRVERGRPRYGIDLDDATIPQEAGLNERAVSFTKGCYVGQETVARLFYKGKPNRHLRGLRLSEPLASGTELTLDGKRVGALGCVVQSPLHGADRAGAGAARGRAGNNGRWRAQRRPRWSSCRSRTPAGAPHPYGWTPVLVV